MNVILIQPPLVQLNSPYPAGAYLSSFFKKQGCNVKWCDFSIALFYSIFSRKGLTKLFSLTEQKALKMAEKAFASGDEATAFNLRRYVSTKASWINWIDVITGILCGNQREKEHEFLFSPYAPRGSRMESFLGGLEKEPSVDDVRFLCSYALADLADYITAVFDPNFSLIRYAEALTVDESSFAKIEQQVASPVMEEFYKPVLDEFAEKLMAQCCREGTGSDDGAASSESSAAGSDGAAAGSDGAAADTASPAASDSPAFLSAAPAASSFSHKTLIGISVPFAGTFTPALYTARYFKQKFGDSVYVVLGGGFVNTELREADEPSLSSYLDGLCYDRGYGAYSELLRTGGTYSSGERLYKFRQFFPDRIIQPDFAGTKEILSYEDKMTSQIVPDFSDIDFKIYPRLCDDKNPMQRLWSDGAWIKAYMAHGCYWHKCAFCDTQLDYVCSYHLTDVEKLFCGLEKVADKNNIYGIHFVDEALPPSGLKRFAVLNAQRAEKGLPPFYYWGNVRFEKQFSYDLAALLSYGGFGGVSAGLEVATGEGLASINKGTDIDSIVSACAAFKEAGILVHAYMIYGFWNDTAQNIINSMETLRQFFEAGLLDSAFWHKFILTKNSQVMADWKNGKHKELKPVFAKEKTMFAKNCLHFEGENKFAKFGPVLENALNSWMHGKRLDSKVQKWFSFEVPAPTVPKNLIENAIEKYEQKKAAVIKDFTNRDIFWLGSRLVQSGKNQLSWMYLQEEMSAAKNELPENAEALLWQLRPGAPSEEHTAALEKAKKIPGALNSLQKLRGSGLVIV